MRVTIHQPGEKIKHLEKPEILNDVKIQGTGVTLANDSTWARLLIYMEDKQVIELSGTPKELRRVASHINSGLREMREIRKETARKAQQ